MNNMVMPVRFMSTVSDSTNPGIRVGTSSLRTTPYPRLVPSAPHRNDPLR